MTVFKAYKITKKYKALLYKYKPEIVQDIDIVERITKEEKDYPELNGNRKHFYTGLTQDNLIMLKNTNQKIFKKTKSKATFFENHKYFFYKKRIDGLFIFSSIGLISLEEFYEAEDIMETFKKVRKKDLVFNQIYVAINKKRYKYIGKFKNSRDKLVDKLEEVSSGATINFSSQILLYP